MVYYDSSQTTQDFQQILDLQAVNLKDNVSPEIAAEQGFVSVRHDLITLAKMNTPYPHVVARNTHNDIVGFALTMLVDFKYDVPMLSPMFDFIDALEYNQQAIRDCRYFVMGQICIAAPYRGQGVFAGLYREMANRMKADYDYIITEISTKNTRSQRAHKNIGFVKIGQYIDGQEWIVVLLDLKKL